MLQQYPSLMPCGDSTGLTIEKSNVRMVTNTRRTKFNNKYFKNYDKKRDADTGTGIKCS